MAGQTTAGTVQIINVDLATERQRILREKLREYFTVLSSKGKVRKEVIYTVNQTNASLEQVLRTNPEADALFTAFAYDAEVSDDFKDTVLITDASDLAQIEPEIRYPALGEYKKLVRRGYFRHRKLILVGDIREKIGQALKSHLAVRASVYSGADRSQVSQPLDVTSLERIIADENAVGENGEKIPVGMIESLEIGGIPFAGVINMPEIKNRFVLNDQTLLDSTRKLFKMVGIKEVLTRERLQEEKLTFVRGKKVFIVLEPDLEHVVSDRLVFDKMQRLWRHASVEEALATLESGQSQGILDYFESQGYDVLFDVLDQEERDRFLVAVLGNRLGEHLEAEIRSQAPNLQLLEQGEVNAIFSALPPDITDQVLEGLKKNSYDKFLALVPPKIRETVILEFLAAPQYVKTAWGGLGQDGQKEVLTTQAPSILAAVYMNDTPFFKEKFPQVNFEFGKNFTSASLAGMSKEEREATFTLFSKSLVNARLPQGIIAHQLDAAELESVMTPYIVNHPAEFFNRLTPVGRKQLWNTVGREYRAEISSKLHPLDKLEILEGNKDAALHLLFDQGPFLKLLNSGEKRELAETIFLTLKKLNQAESKNALLKKVLSEPEWRPNRTKGVLRVLKDPANQATYDKLAEHIEEGFDFSFDSLICTRADYERLKELEPLKDAAVLLVDDLVDASLFNLFQQGNISKEEYNQFSRTVDQELAALRKKMAEREAQDPVGVYLIESMQLLNEMTTLAMAGNFDEETLARMDSRRTIRERLEESLKQHLERVKVYLAKAAEQGQQLKEKIALAEELRAKQENAVEEALLHARIRLKDYQEAMQFHSRLLGAKKKVALTQKELSLEFFAIIRPLLLERTRTWFRPIRRLLRVVGLFRRDAETRARRIIFKFSDEEIEHILRYNVVFCTNNQVLTQFIVTCLRIDGLKDSLFTLAPLESLPSRKIDLLFFGPDRRHEEFQGWVKSGNLVPFADEAFQKRLLGNEKLKATAKAALSRIEKELPSKKGRLEKAREGVREHQGKLAQIEQNLAQLGQEQAALAENVRRQTEQQYQYQGDLEMLETRLSEVDEQFDAIRDRIALIGEADPDSTATIAEAGRRKMEEQLQADLLALTKEMARMMYIKGARDAGEKISKTAQEGLLEKMELRERFPAARYKLKKLIVADDGSHNGKNLKRVFVNVAAAYFRVGEMGVEDISLKRLEDRASTTKSADYPFIAIAADPQEDDFGDLRRAVRHVRTCMPETFQMIFAPTGEIWTLDPESDRFKNIRSIKENGCLINTALADYTNPASVLKLLREKAPLA